ncbi:MAG: hypothetical protein LUG12_01050 [Erysipelotrichaceae bacterium]|nr:hypothetical protein [Erysipelotrichaceae bacterium]
MIRKIFYYIKLVLAFFLILIIIFGGTSIINYGLNKNNILGILMLLFIVGLLLYSAYKHQPTNKLQINPVAIKIIVVVIVLSVVSVMSNNSDETETYVSDSEETNIDYDVIHKSFVESLKANASKNNLTLYHIDLDEDSHVITVYIDNYQGEEISSNDEAYEAIYNYVSRYINLNNDINITIQFGNVINNQSKIYTVDNYYQVSHTKNIYGYYFLRASDVVKYQTEELFTLYDKDVSYSDLISILNRDIDSIVNSGVEIADFSTIHDYEVDGIYDITQYGVIRNNGSGDSNYNVGDYSNAYDFYLENQDVLSEDEAYEIYYDEYGEYD